MSRERPSHSLQTDMKRTSGVIVGNSLSPAQERRKHLLFSVEVECGREEEERSPYQILLPPPSSSPSITTHVSPVSSTPAILPYASPTRHRTEASKVLRTKARATPRSARSIDSFGTISSPRSVSSVASTPSRALLDTSVGNAVCTLHKVTHEFDRLTKENEELKKALCLARAETSRVKAIVRIFGVARIERSRLRVAFQRWKISDASMFIRCVHRGSRLAMLGMKAHAKREHLVHGFHRWKLWAATHRHDHALKSSQIELWARMHQNIRRHSVAYHTRAFARILQWNRHRQLHDCFCRWHAYDAYARRRNRVLRKVTMWLKIRYRTLAVQAWHRWAVFTKVSCIRHTHLSTLHCALDMTTRSITWIDTKLRDKKEGGMPYE